MDLVKCLKCKCEEFFLYEEVNITPEWVTEEEYDMKEGFFKRAGGPSVAATRYRIACSNCGIIYGTSKKFSMRTLKERD